MINKRGTEYLNKPWIQVKNYFFNTFLENMKQKAFLFK